MIAVEEIARQGRQRQKVKAGNEGKVEQAERALIGWSMGKKLSLKALSVAGRCVERKLVCHTNRLVCFGRLEKTDAEKTF